MHAALQRYMTALQRERERGALNERGRSVDCIDEVIHVLTLIYIYIIILRVMIRIHMIHRLVGEEIIEIPRPCLDASCILSYLHSIYLIPPCQLDQNQSVSQMCLNGEACGSFLVSCALPSMALLSKGLGALFGTSHIC